MRVMNDAIVYRALSGLGSSWDTHKSESFTVLTMGHGPSLSEGVGLAA